MSRATRTRAWGSRVLVSSAYFFSRNSLSKRCASAPLVWATRIISSVGLRLIMLGQRQQIVSLALPRAREEDRVNILYGGIDAHGLQIHRHHLRELGDLRLGELGIRPDLDWQGARRIAGFLQQCLRPGGVIAIELLETLR